MTKISIYCGQCGKEFLIKPSELKYRKYCSKKCANDAYKTRFSGEGNPNYSNASIKVCHYCSKPYNSYNKKSKYCSHHCAAMVNNTSEKGKYASSKVKKKGKHPSKRRCICATCGKDFIHLGYKLKYCSKECKPTAKINKICKVCGKIFLDYRHKIDLCSKECSKANRVLCQLGPKSSRWQGGKTEASRLLRNSVRYAEWRTSVFKRDNYTCQMCYSYGNKLAAHHIKTASEHPELIYSLNNGITLCWKCHRSIHWREKEYEQIFFDKIRLLTET